MKDLMIIVVGAVRLALPLWMIFEFWIPLYEKFKNEE